MISFAFVSRIVARLGAGGVSLLSGLATAATAAVIPDIPVNGTTAGVLGGGVAVIVAAAMKLRSIWSRDGVGRGADDYVQKALAHANSERDQFKAERDQLTQDARAAWSSNNADALELGRLRAQVEFLTEALRVNNEMMAEIRRGVQFVGQKVDRVKDRQDSTLAELSKSDRANLGKS